MRTAPARLGELLEKRGQVTREQLLRALRNQKVLGGRLGTCLLEIEAITEEQLCSALVEQYGVPCATPEDLRGIPDDVLGMLPAKIAKRCQAIAFQASTTQVKVALSDARNLAYQDEISFVVGKRIRWHVAPELRLIEALEKHYGEECPSRLAKLLDKMNRSRFLWARESAAAMATAPFPAGDQLQWDTRIAGVAAPAPAASPDSLAAVSGELPHFQHQTLDLPTLSALAVPPGFPAPPAAPAPEPVATPATLAAPTAPAQLLAAGSATPAKAPQPPFAAPEPHRRLTVDEAEQRLLQPRERDDVARVLLDFAAGLVARAVMFVVRKEEVAAWLWSGEAFDPAKLAALRLNLKQPSLFVGLKEDGAYFRGPLSKLPAHVALAACFAAPAIAGDVLVLPVKVKERLVAALLVEPRLASGAELASADLADLQRVIAKAEIAFELCIMRSKLRKA
ncbi:MAG: hypothetical protein ABI689_00390 [Thermoanaerobaculia bacterium]